VPHHDESGRGRAESRRALPEGQWTLDQICADFARREARLAAEARRAGVSRREFLRLLAAGAAAGVAGAAAGQIARAAESDSPPAAEVPQRPPAAPGGEPAPPAPALALQKSRVVLIKNPECIIREYRANPLVVRQMIDRALVALTGKSDERAAWGTVGRAGDFIAIKHNSIGWPTLHSHTEINDAVAGQLVALAGCDPKRILAVDRILPPEYAEFSDPYTLPTRGLKTRLRRLYVDQATAIVNVSVLKCHFNLGVSCAMKNHLGSVNNPSAYHGWEAGRLPANVPELNALEPLRTKTRLCIVDAVRPLFAGGPADDEQYRWDLYSLILGTDPVAVTAVGIGLLEEKRREVRGQAWPMTAARRMVAHGQAIGLGNADPERIDLVRIDVG
jgi:hypothetical protein